MVRSLIHREADTKKGMQLEQQAKINEEKKLGEKKPREKAPW
jgi:hypothetical protein